MTTRRIRTICFVFVCCNSIFSSFCQESKFSSGIFAGENCILATDTNIWAVQTNPALLAYCERTEFGVAYCTNYLATDMVCSRVNACTRMKQLTIASSVIIFGNTHFRHSYFCGSISRKLNQHNSLAIKLSCNRMFQEEFSPTFSVFPEIAYHGIQEKLTYGIHLINALQIFNSSANNIACTKLYVSYRINDIANCSGMIMKKDDMSPTLSLSVSLKIHNDILAGISYSTNESPVSILIRFPLWHINCHYETSYNYYLGMNHSTGFIIKW